MSSCAFEVVSDAQLAFNILNAIAFIYPLCSMALTFSDKLYFPETASILNVKLEKKP